MTQAFYPLANSPIVNTQQWSKVAQNWLGTGVIKGQLNELQVYADSTGLQVKVKTGQAFINGHFFESDTEEVLPITTADTTNPRIDRVIVRLDWVLNTIQLAVLQGTPAASPTAPAITQNSSRWEISLAQVRVNAAASTIAAGNITDERSLVKNANAIQEKWIPLTLQNSWVYYGSGPVAAYLKNDIGQVEIKGFIKNGTTTAGTIIATLPVGYRPLELRSFTVFDGVNSAKRIDVNPNGTLTIPVAVNNAYLIIDLPPFRAEQ